MILGIWFDAAEHFKRIAKCKQSGKKYENCQIKVKSNFGFDWSLEVYEEEWNRKKYNKILIKDLFNDVSIKYKGKTKIDLHCRCTYRKFFYCFIELSLLFEPIL